MKSIRRKPVCSCVERHGGTFYEHTGAYLGTLLLDRFLASGWLVKSEGKEFTATPEGVEGFRQLDLNLPS